MDDDQYAAIEEKWRRGFEALVQRVNEHQANIEFLVRYIEQEKDFVKAPGGLNDIVRQLSTDVDEMVSNMERDRVMYRANLATEAARAGVTNADLARARRDVEAE